MSTKNYMEVLVSTIRSTTLYLSDITFHMQAGLKSTVSDMEPISSTRPHKQEFTIQKNKISNAALSYSFKKTLKHYLMLNYFIDLD